MAPVAGKRVLVVGAGGLGCGALPVLARSPFAAEIRFLDDDRVEPGNLHRQPFFAGSLGQPKAEVAARAVDRLAGRPIGACTIARLTINHARSLVRAFDVVLDGSDNFATKFIVNDACVIERIPFVHAAAIRWQGQLLARDPGRDDPCYRCLFEAPPAIDGAGCAEAGVVGPVVGVVGALQAEAALALLEGRAVGGALHVYDGLRGSLRAVRFRRNPRCTACGASENRPARALDPAAYATGECLA